jgi:signal transduction histidine kinase
LNLPRKLAFVWIVGICVVMVAVLLVSFPIEESIGYVIIYPAAIYLFTGLSYLAKQAAEAQMRSEMLLADLQQANQKLKAYAAQVQELAAAEERNRLARELHDSVTQIIFGLTLSAQAARIMLDRNPSRVAAQLDHMQELAQSALAEMRALIQQLHPRPQAEGGLAAGLRRLAAEREVNDGLSVDLNITGEQRLPPAVEDGLLRVTREALNNIVKHAQTGRARVTLNCADQARVYLCIEDEGRGFDLVQARALPGHLGLTSMMERVQALGGSLEIDSQPGKGTRLTVALPQEVEHA